MSNKFSMEKYLNGETVTNLIGYKILNIFDTGRDVKCPLSVTYIDHLNRTDCIMFCRDGIFTPNGQHSEMDLIIKQDN